MGRDCLLVTFCTITLFWILATAASGDEQLLWSTKLETYTALVLLESIHSVSRTLILVAYPSLTLISLTASLSLTAKSTVPATSN